MPRTSRLLRRCLAGLIPVGLLAGCIGTDLLDERLEFVDPYIALTPVSEAIVVGDQVRYEAVYFDSTGTMSPAPIGWSVSDPDVASIGADGVATGLGAGQTRIVATAGGVASAEALLTVVGDPNAVAQVLVTPSDTSVTVGGGIRYTAVVLNVLDQPLAGRTVAWRTRDAAIAEIDLGGNARTLGTGETTIVATVDGVESAPARLRVLAPARNGSFQAREGTSYNVGGLAILEPRPEGGLQLRFGDNFASSSGPDLYVYLSTSSAVTATSLQVGRLKATAGTQTYALPPNIRITDYDYVIIHCLPFNVTFGFARLI
ncbi:MAG: DM13 domain-containing protein [Rhodothermales bacterium]